LFELDGALPGRNLSLTRIISTGYIPDGKGFGFENTDTLIVNGNILHRFIVVVWCGNRQKNKVYPVFRALRDKLLQDYKG